jgi:lipopolysaccharide transport system permease protein
MTDKTWDIEIKPQKKLFDFKLEELWRYRDLVELFVKRDFVAIYKQTILGPIWFFIQPIFTTIVFMIVFGRVAKIPTDGIPSYLFYMAGILNWNYFAECLNKTSNTFTTNSHIFGKVYFPRLIVPLSIVISNLITYAIQFMLFIILFVYSISKQSYIYHFSEKILLLPLIVMQIALLGFGVGIVVSSLTTKYKDLSFAVVFGVQLGMYATPIAYPISSVPDKWLWLYYLNPMASVIEIFRAMFFDLNNINWQQYGVSWILTIFVLFFGISLFTRIEKSFMDTV